MGDSADKPAGKNRRGAWLTAALWAAGVGLQFAAPLLRDRVPLSDDLLIGSFLAPWWMFAQVALLAGVLALFGRLTAEWSGGARTMFAIAAALLVALLNPQLITQLIDPSARISDDPVSLALLWSMPLAFFVVPAGLVIYSWLKRDSRFSLMRALGAGLVFIGVVNFPFILWLTHLWDVYIRTSGGESVRALDSVRLVG